MSKNKFFRILTINRGSSSLKFALYDMGKLERLVLSGNISRLDLPVSFFCAKNAAGKLLVNEALRFEHHDVVKILLDWLKGYTADKGLDAVGHRVVHGGRKFSRPHLLNPESLVSLKVLIPFDPDHLPREIEAIETIAEIYPSLKQVACFDTAFHRDMPELAQIFPLPGWLKEEGVIRYGFHGLSYEYIMNKLDAEAARGRIIIAHLGSGASMAAVKGGKCIDTTMGFTPTGGLMMATRSGDIDPGVILYLLEQKALRLSTVSNMLNKQSGLLGVSGISSDMEDLLKKEAKNPSAAEAVGLFCYQAKKFLGAFASALGGLDTLIFTGGIGEHAPDVRRRICEGMDYLGINLHPGRNEVNAPLISSKDSPVSVRVIKTNEELMLARHTYNLIQHMGGEKS